MHTQPLITTDYTDHLNQLARTATCYAVMLNGIPIDYAFDRAAARLAAKQLGGPGFTVKRWKRS